MAEFDLIKEGAFDRDDALKRRTERVTSFARPYREFAKNYQATGPLLAAVNVALSLGRPLLLTGEPGSGKTLAAWWIAHRLQLTDHVHEFNVKSDSRARDVCYEFDAVSWYRKSQLAKDDAGEVPKDEFLRPGPLGKAFGWRGPPPTLPSVVLIDEIDKAPRDFPNDLLLELDQMRFTIQEIDTAVICPANVRPIIVITSNAERRLPDPFLRRCVVHRIEIDLSVSKRILTARLKEFNVPNTPLIDAAAAFWVDLGPKPLVRKPTIDEFWRWLALAAQHGGKPAEAIADALKTPGEATRALPFIETLFSSPADLKVATGGA
ncbi:AAA family ATPase [Bradyrhizobium sp. HKCCYLRH1062]|uniref:AAA family ATPase n=1 Tax=unclassified Bradyrhizobium TaxID=2631580 RepID=UPI003EBEE1CE